MVLSVTGLGVGVFIGLSVTDVGKGDVAGCTIDDVVVVDSIGKFDVPAISPPKGLEVGLLEGS